MLIIIWGSDLRVPVMDVHCHEICLAWSPFWGRRGTWVFCMGLSWPQPRGDTPTSSHLSWAPPATHLCTWWGSGAGLTPSPITSRGRRVSADWAPLWSRSLALTFFLLAPFCLKKKKKKKKEKKASYLTNANSLVSSSFCSCFPPFQGQSLRWKWWSFLHTPAFLFLWPWPTAGSASGATAALPSRHLVEFGLGQVLGPSLGLWEGWVPGWARITQNPEPLCFSAQTCVLYIHLFTTHRNLDLLGIFKLNISNMKLSPIPSQVPGPLHGSTTHCSCSCETCGWHPRCLRLPHALLRTNHPVLRDVYLLLSVRWPLSIPAPSEFRSPTSLPWSF